MSQLPPYKIFALSDVSLVVDFGNIIDETINKAVYAVFYQLQNNPLPGMIEAVPAYSSLAVYYDALFVRKKTNDQKTAFQWMKEALERVMSAGTFETEGRETLITVPACYEKEFGPDLAGVASQNNISAEEVIHLHTSGVYRVYMLGFLPGFSYLGMVDKKISAPRKLQPVPVEAGSIGIAGMQTGIYPLRSPGGWQIIGRTPLKLFDKERKNPVLFRAGDRIRFHSITKDEFENIKSRDA